MDPVRERARAGVIDKAQEIVGWSRLMSRVDTITTDEAIDSFNVQHANRTGLVSLLTVTSAQTNQMDAIKRQSDAAWRS